MNRVGVVSLGCSKNRVDTELMLGYLVDAGYTIVAEPENAEIIIVNTCGFIESAKQESINSILEMAQFKQHGKCKILAVTGCLSQRYPDELKAELPEVDLFLGVKEYDSLTDKLNKLIGKNGLCHAQVPRRILTTPEFSAYLRIADGCDNRCTYCAIPLIRGNRVSVPIDELMQQAKALCESGVKEITLIAQDTSCYGSDIYGKPMLAGLLTSLSEIDGLKWLRVLYAYPNTVDEKLIETMAELPKVANYIDMPIQHINDEILKRMNRRGDRSHIERILRHIRSNYPGFIIRSTVMAGFPGETEDQYNELLTFLKENPIDRLGAFAYSQEDGVISSKYADQIPENVKQSRLHGIMSQQQKISFMLNRKRLGSVVEVLIENVGENGIFGRSYAEAPEVDASIIINTKALCKPGDFVKVRITEARNYDLIGEMI